MKFKGLVILVVCMITAVIIYKIKPESAETKSFKRIDTFYSQVRSNPSAFPENVRNVVSYIMKCKEAGVDIPRVKAQWTDPELAPIMLMLKQQATPEQIQGYETWHLATGEFSLALNYSKIPYEFGSETRHAVTRQYGDFTRKHFGAPTVGRERTNSGLEYFLIDENGNRIPKK